MRTAWSAGTSAEAAAHSSATWQHARQGTGQERVLSMTALCGAHISATWRHTLGHSSGGGGGGSASRGGARGLARAARWVGRKESPPPPPHLVSPQADDRHHARGRRVGRRLHALAAQLHQPQPVLKAEGAGEGQGSVLAQAQAAGHIGSQGRLLRSTRGPHPFRARGGWGLRPVAGPKRQAPRGRPAAQLAAAGRQAHSRPHSRQAALRKAAQGGRSGVSPAPAAP
jgi:hypothetical protein